MIRSFLVALVQSIVANVATKNGKILAVGETAETMSTGETRTKTLCAQNQVSFSD